MQNDDPQPRIHDRELLAQAQLPDKWAARAAFTLIWQRYEARLQGRVSWLLGSRSAEAPDVLGNLACDFWKRLRAPQTAGTLEISANDLWPFLRRAAHNQVVAHLTRHAPPSADTSLDALIEHHPQALLDPATGTPHDDEWLCAYSLLLLSQRSQASGLLFEQIGMSPEQVGAAQARAAAWLQDHGPTCFMAALRRLSSTDRDVLILRCVFRQPSIVVGQILGITESAVNQRVWRATRQLRDMYASLLHDQGFSLEQIWQLLVAFEKLQTTLDTGAIDEGNESDRARRVLEFIDSGNKLRGKAKE